MNNVLTSYNENELLYKLVFHINEFDQNDKKTIENLRDILCQTLEDICNAFEKEKNLILSSKIKDLLYIGINKLKFFGYEIMAKKINFGIDKINIANWKDAFMKSFYVSKNMSDITWDYDQKEVIDSFNIYKRILVSAPTSFGKTFILEEIIRENNYDSIVLIFPLNSLLYENWKRFKEMNQKYNMEYKIWNRVSKNIDFSKQKNMFLLTPERFLNLLNEYPNQKFDFIFMDEIYKIDNAFISNEELKESSRDTIFRIAMYNIPKIGKDLYFAGPYLNLQSLGKGFERFLTKNDIKKMEFNVEKSLKNIITKTKGTINELVIEIAKERVLSKNENILIYSKGRKEAFKKAQLISKELIFESTNFEITNEKFKNFIEHLKTVYSFQNPETPNLEIWSLPSLLENGIAVHCGAIPKYIQNQIFDFFNEGLLRIIVSTSSLIEGVNISAKNVIISSAYKGTKLLKKFDIKNIEGRAGRYYSHFIGNIYKIDKEKKMEEIETNDEESIDFINLSEEGNKLLSEIDIVNTDLEDLQKNKDKEKKIKIEEEAIKNNVPIDLLKRNKNVSYENQIKLFKLIKKMSQKEIDCLKLGIKNRWNFISKNQECLKIISSLMGQSFNEFAIKNTSNRLIYISASYIREGIKGLIKYNYAKKKNIDDSILDSLQEEADELQYFLPKYLTIFFDHFKYIHSIDDSNSACEDIINFYELGISSENIILYDNGLPLETIKKIEKIKVTSAENIIVKLKKVEKNKEFTKFEKNIIQKIIEENKD